MRSPEALSELEQRLGVEFRQRERLEQALRHRSAVLDRPRESNERMEFLGDSIVGVVVCEYLYSHYPDASEGDLAKAKAYLVSEPTLAAAGQALGLEEALEMSAGEEASGGRARRSIVSDAFEAVVAAVFLDRGFATARKTVRSALEAAMEEVMRDEYQRDFKSVLQERLQATERKTPHYRIVEEMGAEHDKTFVAHAMSGQRVIGEGTGRSKKEAEQAAAKAALEAVEAGGGQPAAAGD